MSFMPCRGQFVEGRQFRLFISFSESIDSPLLEVNARPFMLPNQQGRGGQEGIHRLGILPGECPSEDTLYPWARQQIISENSIDFEAQMDKLLIEFVPRVGNSHGQHIEALLLDLLKMRCMWKIWSCKQLVFWQQPGGQPISPFDLRLSSIHDSLRLLAAQKISELERNITSNIETHLLGNKKDTARGAQPTHPRLDITKWLLLWQIILMYRQSLGWMLQQEPNNAAPFHPEGS